MQRKYKTTTEILDKVKFLEEEIQAIKWNFFSNDNITPKKKSIIEKSAGILGEKFSKGVSYQKKIRGLWDKKRMSKLNA